MVAVVNVVDVLTALIAGGFSTFTVVEALLVLFEVSVASAHSVVEPFATFVVLQETE
jgi:hypothetical protein